MLSRLSGKCLTYDDVALEPVFSNINSRLEPIMEFWLTKNTKVKCPLIPANMDSVMCDKLADVIIANGGIPIFHRYCPFSQQLLWAKKYKNKCIISSGLGRSEYMPNGTRIENEDEAKLAIKNVNDKVEQLLNAGALGVCYDVAHGHCNRMIYIINDIKQRCPNKDVIAGNVCTTDGYNDLVRAGADAVKVGVGPGSCCTTRLMTGFGIPQFTAIEEIGKVAKKLGVPIIADGGIKQPKDLCIALAAGAQTIMMGKIFSQTNEGAGNIITIDGKKYKHYRGQASAEFQTNYYGQVKKGTVAEGVSMDIPCIGPAQDLIDNYMGGLRSAFSYGGARTIKEYQRKAQIRIVGGGYLTESHTRDK